MKLSEAWQKTRASAQHFGIRYTIYYALKRLVEAGRDFINNKTPVNPLKKWKIKKLLTQSRKLHLGSGSGCAPGWINIDVFPMRGVDFTCDLQHLKKYVPYSSIEAILISHALEHFTKKHVREMLADCNYFLKEQGTLWLSLPSLDLLYETLKSSKSVEVMDKAVGVLMGGGRDNYDLHRCAFSKEYLEILLKEAGFDNISLWTQPPKEFSGIEGGWLASIDERDISLNILAKKAVK